MSDDSDWGSLDEADEGPPPAAAAAAASPGAVAAGGGNDDDESDFFSEPDAEPEQPSPPQQQQQQQQEEEEAAPAAAQQQPEQQQQPGQQEKALLILHTPVLMFLHNPQQGTVAGATVLHAAARRVFTFYFYDQTQRPLVVENVPAGEPASGAAPGAPGLPFALSVPAQDGAAAVASVLQLTDRARRAWRVQFQAPAALFRYAAFALAAAVRSGLAAGGFARLAVARGAGKTLRAGAYGSLRVAAWSMPLDDREVAAFDPEFGGDTEPLDLVHDVQAPADGGAAAPASLGAALLKQRVGGTLLLVAPAEAPVAGEILALLPPGEAAPLRAAGGLVVAALHLAEVHKKKRKPKAARAAKTKAKAAAAAPAAPAAAPSRALVAVPDDGDDEGDAAAEVIASARSLNSSVRATEATQTRILKHVLGGVYEGLVAQFSLGEDGDAGVPAAEVAAALREGMHGAVAAFGEANGQAGARGTAAASLAALQPVLAHVERLVGPGGVADQHRAAAADAAEQAEAVAELHARLARAEEENARLGQTQLELATRNMELEEELGRAREAGRGTETRAKEADVFEEALGEMRRMLEQEVEARNLAEEELANLEALQKKHKLTWVPKRAVDSCVGCGERFRAFGSRTKQHCHYCGRVFCKPCTDRNVPVPELGYRDKVRVCRHCYGILCDEQGPGEADEEEDE